jgi:hypothetical protein
MLLPEALLQWVQLAILRQALDRGNLGTIGLHREDSAAFHALAIDMDNAGSTLAGIAADMGASKVQLFTQVMNKQRSRFDIALVGPPIDRD